MVFVMYEDLNRTGGLHFTLNEKRFNDIGVSMFKIAPHRDTFK